jgi:hypothetical protein
MFEGERKILSIVLSDVKVGVYVWAGLYKVLGLKAF